MLLALLLSALLLLLLLLGTLLPPPLGRVGLLGLGGLLLPALLLTGLLLLSAALLLLALGLGLGLFRLLGRRCGRGRRYVGIYALYTGRLIVLGQVLEYHGQLVVVQILPRLLRLVKVFAQDFYDLLRLHSKIPGQVVHLVSVYNIAQ